MSATPLLTARDNGVLRLTLNRPAERNALSQALLQAMIAAVEEAGADAAVRAVVIAAEGPAFSAGHDLREIAAHYDDADHGRGFSEGLFATCTRLMTAIRESPLIFIAEVQGTATAAGAQLAATCDMVVASSAARFGLNGIDVGLFCSTPMVAVARNLPRKLALELLTTGRLMGAEEAHEAGLVNRITKPEELRGESDALAAKVTRQSRAVLALGKRAFYDQIGRTTGEAYAGCEKVIVDNLMMDDAAEGIAAFFARRPPRWKDR